MSNCAWLRQTMCRPLDSLVRLYSAAQNWNGAIEVLQHLVAVDPTNYEHPYMLAQILQQVGQPETALTYANQALDARPRRTEGGDHSID